MCSKTGPKIRYAPFRAKGNAIAEREGSKKMISNYFTGRGSKNFPFFTIQQPDNNRYCLNQIPSTCRNRHRCAARVVLPCNPFFVVSRHFNGLAWKLMFGRKLTLTPLNSSNARRFGNWVREEMLFYDSHFCAGKEHVGTGVQLLPQMWIKCPF